MKKKFLALLLVAIMVVSLIPTTVFATGTSYTITNGTPESAKETNHGYIAIDNATAAKGETVTITVKPNEGYQLKSLTVTLATLKAVYDTTGDANTLTFYYDVVDHSGEGITVYEDGTTNYLFDNSKSNGAKWGYNSIRSSVKSVKIDSSVADYKSLTSTAYMFQGMTTATNISGAEYLDVSNVTDMSLMFQYFGGGSAGSPTTLNVVPDVSEWNTGNVTNMIAMFAFYGNFSSSLDKVPDVSNWNTDNVTDMSLMFQKYGHESQTFNAVPDVSKWNTGNVTNMANMFFEYGNKSTKLDTVPDVSKWNTASVKSMKGMFTGYGNSSTALTAVPIVSKWNTANVTTMADMFQNYGKNSVDFVLDLSGWDLSKITGTNGNNVFNFNPKTFDVKIPAKTGEKSNEGDKWYYGDGTKNITPPEGMSFTPPAPTEYTVTFDLNGITGTAPTSQTIKDGAKVTEPADPTDTVHTFAGWYKTKDATTGVLSDPWDFNNGTVTANMTLYAQWTRKISTIVGTTTDIPTVDDGLVWSKPSTVSIPEDAWITGEGQSAFWVSGDDSGLAMLYTIPGIGGLSFGFDDTDTFTKVGDTYVYSTEFGTATCTMTDDKLTSITFAGNDLSGSGNTDLTVLNGTYAAPVKYMVWDETNKQLVEKKTSDFIEVTNPKNPLLGNDLTLKAGEIYVVKGIGIERGTITVNGTINNPTTLIICDGAKLTAGTIRVASDKALVITGQSGCTGELVADGSGGAGIGGIKDAGNITINGGKITAIGGTNAAGIGGGENGNGGTITINGGVVIANGDTDAAGIGGGNNGNGGTVTINGGTVTATGGAAGAGIGGGLNGDGGIVTINDGKITATGGSEAAGIGGGNKGNGGTVTINGGTVTASGGSRGIACGGAGIGGGFGGDGASVTINGGKVTATGGKGAAGIGGGQWFSDGTIEKGGNGGTVIINGGSVEAVAGTYAEAIGKGISGSTSGTVTFKEGVTFSVKAGESAPGAGTNTTEYAGDHSAAYVSIESAPANKLLKSSAPNLLKSSAPKLLKGSAPGDPKTITPAKQDDGTYQFTMPAANVIVTAEFEAVTPTHNPVIVNGQAATETDAGYKSYYECTHCKKYYEDATGLIEIADLEVWKSKNGNGYIPSGNEINAAKTAAKAALDSENAKDPLNVETSLTTGKTSIDKAATLADIEKAKDAAITTIKEAQAAELAAAKAEAKSVLDKANENVPLKDETPIINGKAQIDAQTTKASVETAKKAALEAIEKAQDAEFDAENAAAVDEVVKMINAIGKVEFTDACKNKIEAARDAYDELNDDQQEMISAEQYKVLTDAENAYSEFKKKDEKKAATLALDKKLKVTTGKSIKVEWGKVPGAAGYDIYMAYCGKSSLKVVKTIKSSKVTSATVNKLNKKAIDQAKHIKCKVVAYKVENGKKVTICESIVAHAVGKLNKSVTDAKSIKLSKSSYKLKVGGSATIKATTVKKNKKLPILPKSHAPEFRYASADDSIVTVSKTGKITARGKGSCYVYVYAVNGCCKQVKVTVK